jgi:hypothetical protein
VSLWPTKENTIEKPVAFGGVLLAVAIVFAVAVSLMKTASPAAWQDAPSVSSTN